MYQNIIKDNESSWENMKIENAKMEELKRRQTETHMKTVSEHVHRAEELEFKLKQVNIEFI